MTPLSVASATLWHIRCRRVGVIHTIISDRNKIRSRLRAIKACPDLTTAGAEASGAKRPFAKTLTAANNGNFRSFGN